MEELEDTKTKEKERETKEASDSEDELDDELDDKEEEIKESKKEEKINEKEKDKNMKEGSDKKNNSKRTYNISITYDFYYNTPRMWIQGSDADNKPLTEAQIYDDIMSKRVKYR